VIVGTEITDISLNKINLFNNTEFPFEWDMVAFVSAAIVYIIGQHVLLKFVRKGISDIPSNERSHFSIIRKITRVIQYALIAILILVILQISITSYYSIRLLITSIWISYALAIFMLGFLTRQFFYWFKSNRNIVVLFYGLSTGFIGIDAAISLVLSTSLLIGQPLDVYPTLGASEGALPPANLMPLENAFVVASIISFTLTWIATALMLRHHSRRFGMIKYWVLVSIPLVYFLTQFQPLFLYVFSSYMSAYPISFSIAYTIVFSASKPASGLLFAAAFWSLARRVRTTELRNYMFISAYGLALIFASEQAIILVNKPYPPFGLPTISFLGLSSYLLLIGIYSSAISVSEDSKLRQSIRNSALRETKLLDSIGMAQMEQEIQRRVIALTKQNQDRMVVESGIQSSLTEEDMKEYLQQVISEVKKQKTSTDKTNNGNT
jgi:hypothetical protein